MAKPARGGRRGQNTLPNGIKQPRGSHTEEEALKMTNPNYMTDSNCRINCQRCIWAYEMNRRGYDVEALPFKNDELARGMNFLKIAENVSPEFLSPNPFMTFSNKKAEKAATERMKGWGEGSRGAVIMRRRNGAGHVFNVEYRNGKITVFEAQTGEKMPSLAKYLTEQKSVPSYVQIFRTDNAKLKDSEIPRYVKQR